MRRLTRVLVPVTAVPACRLNAMMVAEEFRKEMLPEVGRGWPAAVAKLMV